MSYLHCHACNWCQDDFWSEHGYTPLRRDTIDWLKSLLFKEKISLDTYLCIEQKIPILVENGGICDVDPREFVANELERIAKRIRNMNVKTYEEWNKVEDNWRCPKCGSNKWDID